MPSPYKLMTKTHGTRTVGLNGLLSVPAAALIRGVLLVCTVLIISIWGLVLVDLHHERKLHVAQAERDTVNLGIAFENNVVSTLNTIDGLLLSLRHEVLEGQALTSSFDLVNWVHNGPLRSSIVQVAVIDANGYLAFTSANQSSKPVFVGDRDHFKAHVGASDDKMYVGNSIRARTSDVDVIPFSRRMVGRDGSFRGVVSVLLRADYFSRFFDAIDIGDQGAVTLVRDGQVLARASRQVPPHNPIGMDVSSVLPEPGVMVDTRMVLSPVDGLNRLRHFRQIKDHPLAVIVSLTEQDYLAEFQETIQYQLLIAGTTFCALIAMAFALIFMIRRLEATRLQAATHERRLRDIVENTSVVTWELDPASWRFTYVSPQVEALFGYPADDWLGENFWPDHMHPQDRERATGFCSVQTELGQDHNFEYRFMKQDGGEAWVRDLVKVVKDQAGKPKKLTGVMIDITREKADAASMAKHQALIRTLIDSVPDLIFFKDNNSVYLGSNAAFAEFSGRSEADQLGKTDFDFFDHDTAQAFRDNDLEMVASRHSRRNEEWVTYPDGRRVLLDTVKSPLAGADGQVHGIVGISRDITESKRAEEGLLVAKAVFDATHEGIMVTDAQARIVSINPAFTTITGWSAGEAVGNKAGFMKSGRHSTEFYGGLWHQLNEAGFWEGEIWNHRKSGELYVQWITINTIVNARHTVTGYVAVFTDITQRKKHEEKITQQANFDALTGLANRNLFTDRLERALSGARRKQSQVGLMFLDLDHFKWINDTLGHDAGDTVLVQAAARLQACVREQDTVARLGGDEFAIVLEGLSGHDPLQSVAEKVIASLAQAFTLDGTPRFISGSVGVTVFPSDADNSSDLLRNADIAMYQAKTAGRNGYRFYSADMQAGAMWRVEVEHDLRQAIAHGGLVLHYQPMVEANSQQLIGIEALLRWTHPKRGLLTPGDFMTVAEDCGLSHTVGEWVINEVCRQWRVRVDAGRMPLRTSINVSAMHARHSGLRVCIEAALSRHHVPGAMLSLELTEAVVLGHGIEASNSLTGLKDIGLHFSLDDFGTGYSSLTALHSFPFDTVKIDRTFIAALSASVADQQMVNAIVSMAHKLHLKVVAEGVESQEQLDFLRTHGCDFVQGYLIGAPMLSDQLDDFVSNHASRCRQSG